MRRPPLLLVFNVIFLALATYASGEPQKRNVFASHLYNYENMARAAAEGSSKKAFPSKRVLAGFWSNVERAATTERDLKAAPSKRVLAGFWTNVMKSRPEERQVDKRRMPHENFNKMREFDDSLDPFNDHYDMVNAVSKRGVALDCNMLSKRDCHRMLQRIFGPPGPFGYLHM